MQRSYRCPCSVRALEAFVRDVAGLDIRQRRNNLGFRNLSTRSSTLQSRHSFPLRVSERVHDVASSLDDAFVPFETVTDHKHPTATHDTTSASSSVAQSNNTEQTPEPFDPNEELGSIEEFEPEIVIHEDQAQTKADPIVEDAWSQQLGLRERNQAIDAVFLPDLLAQTQHKSSQHHTVDQRLDIFSAPRPAQQYPGKNARKKARRAAEIAEAQPTLPEQETQSPEASSKAKKRKADRKEAKRAAQATQVSDTATLEQATFDQETASIASLIASATSPKPLSAAKASKIALAIKTRKDNERAAKRAAAEKLIQDQQAAKQAQKERNRNLDKWKVQKTALREKFGDQDWNPRKRISPDALAGIRALHAKSPEVFSTPVLAEHFKVPPEAIRRILKSKWQPTEEEAEERRDRWEKRGVKKWSEMAEQGIKPPKMWRDRGVGRVGPGELPPWKQPGKAGERWIQSADADRFVMAGDQMAEEEMAASEEDYQYDNIASRIL